MSVKPPIRPADSTDKVVKELLKQLPHADPDLKGDPTLPAAKPRQRPSAPQIMKPPPPGWQRSWGWLSLAVVLGVGITQWPYDRGCGFPLYGYMATVVLLSALSIWAVAVSWLDRRAVAHGLAILTMFGATVLTAEVVLPRVGYAKSGASWSCQLAAAAEAEQPATAAGAMLPAINDSAAQQPVDSLADSVTAAADTAAR